MRYKKGIVHLFAIILIFILFIAIPLIIAKFVFKKNLPFLSGKKPNVTLKAEYKNPFDKKTQYVNPFEDAKNPFANLNE